jgi:hypothetical protein
MTKDVRITDRHTVRLVEGIRKKRGDKTLAKTARDLIRERIISIDEHHDLEKVRQAGTNAVNQTAA